MTMQLRDMGFFTGLAVGAGLMYMLDPDRGARRRSMARDQVSHALHKQRSLFDKGVRDLRNRASGVPPRMRGALLTEAVSDETLVERVRARLGHRVSHPGSIEVTARDGEVTLRGPIFASEVPGLLRCVRRVHGVRAVDDRLEPHRTAGDVPGLQGEPPSPPRPLLGRKSWPPALRLLAAGTGLAAGLHALRRGGVPGRLLGTAGAVILARALTNLPVRHMAGTLVGRRVVALHKSTTVEMPVQEVFEYWSRGDRFPLFMTRVREVRCSEDGKRSHWKVDGPAHTTLTWDAEITAMEPGKMIAWKTLPGSALSHTGVVHFEEVDAERTRLDIRMSYEAPAGVLGHAAAKLFHLDPKTMLDEDMVRLQSLLAGGGDGVRGAADGQGAADADEAMGGAQGAPG